MNTLVMTPTHFEARDAPKPAEKKEKAPKKRGRKSKEEREAWLLEQAEIEANLTTYEIGRASCRERVFPHV